MYTGEQALLSPTTFTNGVSLVWSVRQEAKVFGEKFESDPTWNS